MKRLLTADEKLSRNLVDRGKPIYVKVMGEWVPATEVDLGCRIAGDPEAWFHVWDIETLQTLLDSAIEKENYEQAGLINKVLQTKLNIS